MSTPRLLFHSGVLLLFSFSAVSSFAQTARAVTTTAALLASATPAPPDPQLQQRSPRYTIHADDMLTLSYPLSSEFNQVATVQPDGYITLLNGTNLHVKGMTVPELAEGLKAAYAGTLHDPIVNVDLKAFHHPFYTVSGQVFKPGQYDLPRETTVAEALAVAGGMAPTAKTQVFLFRKTPDNRFEVTKLNIKDVLNGKKVNEDPTLRSGDMIYVPEKFITSFRKYVPYSIGTGTYINQSQVY